MVALSLCTTGGCFIKDMAVLACWRLRFLEVGRPVPVEPTKINPLNQGRVPIIEQEIGAL